MIDMWAVAKDIFLGWGGGGRVGVVGGLNSFQQSVIMITKLKDISCTLYLCLYFNLHKLLL